CGVARADSILPIETSENVRGFLGREEDGKQRKSTLVNLAIKKTLEDSPSDFALLNSGVVILAPQAEVEDSKKIVYLKQPSIINGAQTKGVLAEFFDTNGADTEVPSINFELIVADDEELAAEISIARNYQNRVEDISIYGKLGRFDELEKAMQKEDPKIILRKRETDFGEQYLDTEKLIQVISVLAPESVDFPS